MTRVLREYVRTLLEGPGDSNPGLALAVKRTPDSVMAVLYHPERALEAFSYAKRLSISPSMPILTERAVVGYLRIQEPEFDCEGAWEFVEVWGPGHSSLLADLAFSLAPGNTLLGDRKALTEKGRKFWRGVSQRLKNTAIRIDPSKCPTQHGENKEDDYLNYAYSSPGNPRVLRSLESAHEDLLKLLDEERKRVEDQLFGAAWSLFEESLV